MRTLLRSSVLWICTLSLSSLADCQTEIAGAQAGPQAEVRVVRAYSEYAFRCYRSCRESAQTLQQAVRRFLASPSKAGLAAARSAWIAARDVYGESEVLRFYSGPIDNAKDGPETLLNAWPLDEVYIDVVRGNDRGGILQDTKHYPNLGAQILMLANERGGEANVCLGWHAIEFMLWGQDFDTAGPGRRSHLAFVDQHDAHAARRRRYLEVITNLLVAHLSQLERAWRSSEPTSYRCAFEANPTRAVRNMLTGLVVLSGFELGGERMAVAYETQDQEDEHSCFSDTTHRDFLSNQRGIVHVYRGTGAGMDGVGLRDLAAAVDPELAKALDQRLDTTSKALQSIPQPFDQAILGEDDAKGRKAVLAALHSLEAQTDLLAALGLALGHEIPIKPASK